MASAKATKMFPKGIAIIALTKQGVETAAKISDVLEKLEIKTSLYSPEQCVQGWATPLDMRLGEFVKEIFGKVDAIIAVMAAGIIVRAIAPCLKSKLTDPAVVCVDVSGRFAISLLSGHYGGANELARIIARETGATPVITTASDVMGKVSVDEVARLLNFKIQNPESLVGVNSALVNGKRVVLVVVGDMQIPTNLISSYEVKRAKTAKQATALLKDFDAGAIITETLLSTGKLPKPVTILTPKKIVVGVGARKNSSENQIIAAVDSALARVNLAVERVDRLATVDIKKDSLSMVRFALNSEAPRVRARLLISGSTASRELATKLTIMGVISMD